MPIARPEPQDARVIAHIDMDCFYVQVEQRKNPELRGLPSAVIQYNAWKGGALIAVGYEARKFGVKRSMRGDEAKKVCPNINLVQVPVLRGKADLNSYRDAGSEVVSILSTRGRCERASIDEVYLDLTCAAEKMLSDNPPELAKELDVEVLKAHVLGVDEEDCDVEKRMKEWICRTDAEHRDKLLACGAIIVAQLRMRVLEETSFTCSAGIAHNKMLAKLASGMHKPAQQTVVPSSSVKNLLASFPIKKMKQLGGKLGSSLQSGLGINTVGDLLHFSEEKLQEYYGINTGSWLWNIARGINGEEVRGRLLPKSHGCGKTFPGPQALRTITSVEHWLNQLGEELSERIQSDLDKNKRIAQTLTLHAIAFKANNDSKSHKKFPSKSCPLRYGATKIQEDVLRLFEAGLQEFLALQNIGWGVTSLSIRASKVVAMPSGTSSILKFFHGKKTTLPSNEESELCETEHNESMSGATSMLEEIPSDSDLSANDWQGTEPSRVKTKGKEPCLIMRFFHKSKLPSSRSSIGNRGHDQYNPGPAAMLLQGNICNSEPLKAGECNNEHSKMMSQLSDMIQPVHNSSTWSYNIDDIDPSVVDELPLEIQREVQELLRPQKQVKTVKKGHSISDYFSPI